MPNTIFSSEGALLFIMFATVALGFWLQRFKAFKTLGPALTVIVMGIVMSNLRIVPTSSATYDAISSYCVPLSVSICLLSLDLKQMRKLSKEPVIALASPDNANAFELTAQEAEEWYRGRDVYPQAAPTSDDVLVTFQHQPLGLAKRIGSRLKNSYPRELVRDGKLFTGNP